MDFKKMPELRRWTNAAIYCYSRSCVCSGCFYKEHLESRCLMKQTVSALYTKLGKPNQRGRKMLKKQLSIIEHYGIENQYKKLVEELDELKEAIVENHNEGHIIEEMADVLNVMQGIIAKCKYEKDIKDMQEFKLKRQIRRIYRENRKDKECAEEL